MPVYPQRNKAWPSPCRADSYHRSLSRLLITAPYHGLHSFFSSTITPMKIAILDDYQDCVRHLDCFSLLDGHEVKIFTTGARGVGQLAIRLAPFDALVLIRERTALSRALLQKLPNLNLISQTGKVSGHIDVAAASETNNTNNKNKNKPTAPAELTWALIMAAARR